MQGLMQDYPLTITHIFDRAEKLFGHKEIVTATATGIERTSYKEWAERTRLLGGALDTLECSNDARVGTFAWNTGKHLELYFGIPCTGRVMHTLNIRLFKEQLIYTINHAADEVIFIDRSLIGLLWPIADELKTVRNFVVMDDGTGDIPDDPRIVEYEKLLGESKPVDFVVEDENQAAATCYTSGTTGNPKGVVYSHRSTVLHSVMVLAADTLGLSETDRILPIVPMFHANAWGLPYAGVFAGSDFVFPGPSLAPDHIVNLIEKEKVTFTAGVPTIWMGVLPLIEGRDLSSLRLITAGGSAVPKSLSEAFREKLGLPLLQGWGMTETSPVASLGRVKSNLAGKSDDEKAVIRSYAGMPVPFCDIRIVAEDSGEELAWDGEVFGELQIRGPYIASRYYNDPTSDEKFTPDGWLRTGDVASLTPDGYIKIVDRTKDVIKSGGEWVSSVELENEIMAHPKVAEAAVIGVPHPKWMERPIACVVAKEGEELTKEEILEFLEPRVAKWWLPEDVQFIEEIPKTSVGKFSKKDLRKRFEDYQLPT
ncbi:MAG TPA: long-chain fatty acid--CoA ligase [Actinomycetota bacterium]|nr:long-chain fatty acid--CoA ligase [Actinomycetota bacterium]